MEVSRYFGFSRAIGAGQPLANRSPAIPDLLRLDGFDVEHFVRPAEAIAFV